VLNQTSASHHTDHSFHCQPTNCVTEPRLRINELVFGNLLYSYIGPRYIFYVTFAISKYKKVFKHVLLLFVYNIYNYV